MDEICRLVGTTIVLPDYGCKCIKREYKRVFRKANVGDLIQIFSHPVLHFNGINKVKKWNEVEDCYFEFTEKHLEHFEEYQYLVLEPTGTIWVNNKRYKQIMELKLF